MSKETSVTSWNLEQLRKKEVKQLINEGDKPLPSPQEPAIDGNFIPYKNFEKIEDSYSRFNFNPTGFKNALGFLEDNNMWWRHKRDGTLCLNVEQKQQEQRTASLGYVKSFETAIDIGAHIGFWARELREKFKKLIAFEPQAIFREAFVHNVNMSNVTLYPYALSNESSSFTMNNMVVTDNQKGSVEARTLDSFNIQDKIDYIKLDIEGWEIYALEGAKETLLKNRPVIVLEQKFMQSRVNHGRPARLERGFNAASEYLEHIGFKMTQRIHSEFIFTWRNAR
jgi:FkbM family methyltransferase